MSSGVSFSVWDYVVFSIMLLVSAGIGLFYGCFRGGNKTTQEFLMADRQMSVVPITLSLLASFMSAITILGVPAENYIHGTQYLMIGIAYTLLMPIVAYVYVPIYYRLKLTSAYEYLEIRYRQRAVKYIGSLTFIVMMILYMAIVLYAPCLALNAVTGINLWASCFTVGVVCTFYTTLGGMKAVMWTDVFQVVMMMAGLVAVVIKGSIDQGGFDNVWEIARQGQRVEFFNLDPDPRARHTVWSLAIGGIFQWLVIYGINQSQVQRALTAPTLRKAQLAVLLNAPGLVILLILTSFSGLVVYAHYRHCDPLTTGRIIASDQILPLYVMDALNFPGIPGLFVACVFSGSLSSISSGLNSLAAVTMQDFVRGCWFTEMTEQKATRCAKILALLYGVLMMVLSVLASQVGAVLQAALSLFGMLSGPLLGLFTLGMVFPQANWKGGVTGWLIALVLQFWMGIGAIVVKPPVPSPPTSIAGCNISDIMWLNQSSMTSPTEMWFNENVTTSSSVESESLPMFYDLYRISYLWYGLISLVMVILIGLPISLITGGEDQTKLDRRTLVSLSDIFSVCTSHKPGTSDDLQNSSDAASCEKKYALTQSENGDSTALPLMEKL